MSSTARLFMFMAIFAGITFGVYLSCLWMIRIEERRQARRAKR
jgi:MFS superfamily sulfate permease-like transporter